MKNYKINIPVKLALILITLFTFSCERSDPENENVGLENPNTLNGLMKSFNNGFDQVNNEGYDQGSLDYIFYSLGDELLKQYPNSTREQREVLVKHFYFLCIPDADFLEINLNEFPLKNENLKVFEYLADQLVSKYVIKQ